jgi:hypothetical protein
MALIPQPKPSSTTSTPLSEPRKPQSTEAPVIFCDTVQSLGVHNGVARISFIRLDSDGKPTPALEMLMPVGQAESFVRALHAVARPGGGQT